MSLEVSVLRDEVAVLTEEVESLKGELTRVRRNFAKLQRLVESRLQVSAGELDTVSEDNYSVVSDEVNQPRASAAYPSSSPSPVRVNTTNNEHTPSGGLNWKQREDIADEVGQFIGRSIRGEHRGCSGRNKLPISSKYWIIARDYSGQIYDPVKVVRSWSSCRVLCKPNNVECGDSVFVGFPSERECRRAVWAAGLTFPQTIEP